MFGGDRWQQYPCLSSQPARKLETSATIEAQISKSPVGRAFCPSSDERSDKMSVLHGIGRTIVNKLQREPSSCDAAHVSSSLFFSSLRRSMRRGLSRLNHAMRS